MKKRLACLLCAVALLVPGGCTPAGEVSPTPESPAPSAPLESTQTLPPIRKPFAPNPTPTPAPSPTPEELAEFLAGLTAEDILFSGEYIGTPGTTVEDFLALLQKAVEHPVAGDDSYHLLWSIDLQLKESDAGEGGPAPTLGLDVGLTENLVEISLGSPWQPLWVEDEDLYQLVRSAHDCRCQIDREALALYQETVDAFLLETDYWSERDISHTHELVGFELVDRSAALNAQVYRITHVFITDPPELAADLLAGGCYLDSQLRYYPNSSDPRTLLVTMDDKALGIAPVSWLRTGGGLAQYGSKEALLADFPA